MNERIREIAQQCWNFRVGGSQFDQEMFAELIIRECIEICRSDDWEDQQGWGKLYAHKIKKHFGVK